MRELSGDAADAHVARLAAAIRRARLNAHYPAPRRLAAHLEAMGAPVHGGLYDALRFDPSGLPTYREWARVQTDRQIAPQALADLGPVEVLEARAAPGRHAVHDRQLTKHRYYEALLARELAPLSGLSTALRRVDPRAGEAHFHVVFDKLDAAGLFVRHSVDLAEQAATWSRPLVALDGDVARKTEALESLVHRFGTLDAELMFVQLAADPTLRVERVVKGTVGPAWTRPDEAPSQLAAALSEPGALVMSFALDMAAVDLADDRDNDPLDDPLAARLTPEARAEYEAARRRLGFKVFRDRKFVVTANARAAVERLCAERGTRCIIYTL